MHTPFKLQSRFDLHDKDDIDAAAAAAAEAEGAAIALNAAAIERSAAIVGSIMAAKQRCGCECRTRNM